MQLDRLPLSSISEDVTRCPIPKLRCMLTIYLSWLATTQSIETLVEKYGYFYGNLGMNMGDYVFAIFGRWN
jgi:hypothetical protein